MKMIYTSDDIGALVKEKRKALGMTQVQLANMSGKGVRFISDLENGKPTMQMGKVLDTLLLLGFDLSLSDRAESKTNSQRDPDDYGS